METSRIENTLIAKLPSLLAITFPVTLFLFSVFVCLFVCLLVKFHTKKKKGAFFFSFAVCKKKKVLSIVPGD